ncbi:hypothetical protein [Rubrobacter xylanophilus]|uniref:hypothetical protein n=1 Tax=Rubrobacter xylanophilus TaxID=49319 RepID=UPI00003A1F19|nr:hypothetical protein [Rubrobacter xylanophilus]
MLGEEPGGPAALAGVGSRRRWRAVELPERAGFALAPLFRGAALAAGLAWVARGGEAPSPPRRHLSPGRPSE